MCLVLNRTYAGTKSFFHRFRHSCCLSHNPYVAPCQSITHCWYSYHWSFSSTVCHDNNYQEFLEIASYVKQPLVPCNLITLRPRQNGRHFADEIFKWIFLNENVWIWIPIKITLKFVPQGPINNIPALVQIMVWRRPGDKPLSGPMTLRVPTHTCVTRPQWVIHICLNTFRIHLCAYIHKSESVQMYLCVWHDDVIKWKHFPRYWPFVRGIHRSPVNSPHKGQWRGALMFTLICARINGWVNNREAGDLRRYRAHYDVIVMTMWYGRGKPPPPNQYIQC